jgi:hypothetical protein
MTALRRAPTSLACASTARVLMSTPSKEGTLNNADSNAGGTDLRGQGNDGRGGESTVRRHGHDTTTSRGK